VEVGNRRRLGLTSGEPLRSRRPLTLPAMAVSARVLGDASEPAIVAALDVTAERRGAAGRDRSDHAPLHASEMSGVRPFVTLAVTAEDVGQFERRPRRHPLFRRRHLERQSIQRALDPGDHLRRDARVAGRGGQVLVAQRHLDDMGGEAMAQDVHAHPLVEPRRGRRRTASRVKNGGIDRRVGRAAREQERLGPRQTPVAPQVPSSCSDSMT